jgi:uncharacterized membrane protein
MESHLRSILKAITWRAGGTAVTVLTAWLITGQQSDALKIGLLDTVLKIAVFYVHERFWNRLSIGKMKSPEYQI